jgi:hypothetical protein
VIHLIYCDEGYWSEFVNIIYVLSVSFYIFIKFIRQMSGVHMRKTTKDGDGDGGAGLKYIVSRFDAVL